MVITMSHAWVERSLWLPWSFHQLHFPPLLHLYLPAPPLALQLPWGQVVNPLCTLAKEMGSNDDNFSLTSHAHAWLKFGSALIPSHPCFMRIVVVVSDCSLFDNSIFLSLLTILFLITLSLLLPVNFIFQDVVDKFPVHFRQWGPWHLCRVRPSHTTCMDLLDLRLSRTRTSKTSGKRPKRKPRRTKMHCSILCTSSIWNNCRDRRVLWSDQGWQSHRGDAGQVNDDPRKRTHERWDHWIPKCIGTVVVVGTAVSARLVSWCVSGGSETEQGDALRCQSVEQTCRAGEKHSWNWHCHSLWCVNLETCSVVCYADAVLANAEGEKSLCGLVVGLTHHPELVKSGRARISLVVSVFVDGSAHGSKLSEGRREGELEEASTRVHRQRQLGKTL